MARRGIQTYVSFDVPHALVPRCPQVMLVLPPFRPNSRSFTSPPLGPRNTVQSLWEQVLSTDDDMTRCQRLSCLFKLVALVLGDDTVPRMTERRARTYLCHVDVCPLDVRVEQDGVALLFGVLGGAELREAKRRQAEQ